MNIILEEIVSEIQARHIVINAVNDLLRLTKNEMPLDNHSTVQEINKKIEEILEMEYKSQFGNDCCFMNLSTRGVNTSIVPILKGLKMKKSEFENVKYKIYNPKGYHYDLQNYEDLMSKNIIGYLKLSITQPPSPKFSLDKKTFMSTDKADTIYRVLLLKLVKVQGYNIKVRIYEPVCKLLNAYVGADLFYVDSVLD